jgi:hypothetical protein
MTGISVTFKNIPRETGFETVTVADCLVANNGSPQASRPQILIHLPKADETDVVGGWVEYEGHDYYVAGVTVPQMDRNTPTRWNRYAIAERIRAL